MTSYVHPTDDTMVRFVDGDLTENDSAALRAHLPACDVCATRVASLRSITGALAAPAVVVDGDAEAVAVLRKIRVADAGARAPRARSWWIASGGMLAATAALLLFARGTSTEMSGEVRARGGRSARSELARKVGIELDVALENKTARISGVYRNLLDRPAYALVFAVDSHEDVHWIYPAFTDEKSDVAAVVLAPKTSRAAFAEGAVLESPALGNLRIVTLISPACLHVFDIEHLDPKARALDALRKRYADAEIAERSVVLK